MRAPESPWATASNHYWNSEEYNSVIHSSNRLDSFVRYRDTHRRRTGVHIRGALFSSGIPVWAKTCIEAVDLGTTAEGRIAHGFKKGGQNIAVSVRCMHTESEERETHPSCVVKSKILRTFLFLFFKLVNLVSRQSGTSQWLTPNEAGKQWKSHF